MSFTFKQFHVADERCAMKVGTDGTLLGAWTQTHSARSILDIGTGSGLIALMLAQRVPSAMVVGVEIDEEAARQALENATASPFSARIRLLTGDVRTKTTQTLALQHTAEGAGFDLIVSNPPFFTETLHAPQAARAQARSSAESLTFADLLQAVAHLLAPHGSFALVLPYSAAQDFIVQAAAHALHLSRRTHVITRPGKAPRRVLLQFQRAAAATPQIETLTLQGENGEPRSKAYAALCQDFYL